MPKFGVHHVVLANAIEQQLLTSKKTAARKAGEALAGERAAAMLGAVGPDLFFFAPDYESMQYVIKLYENIESALELYEQVAGPVREINEEVIEPVDKKIEEFGGETVALIKQALQQIKDTAPLLKAALNNTLLVGVFKGLGSGLQGVSSVFDAKYPSASALFYSALFTPDIQKSAPVTKWTWFDTLHYRRTGEFAQSLVAHAATPTERAYALGYLSHIATDVLGHPYVNCVVGSPYRLNVQRHVTVENYIDCWKFDRDFGESVNGTLLTRLGLTEQMPAGVDDLLHKAFASTFKDPSQRPRLVNNNVSGLEGFLTPAQIRDTYKIFHRVMRIMQKSAVRRPEEPFPGAADILDKAIGDFLDPPPPPPPPPTKACGVADIFSFGLTKKSKECYKRFFEKAGEYLKYAAKMLDYAFETLADLVDLVLAAFLAMPALVLMAILYGIQLLAYEVYRFMHSLLAQEGFVYPEPGDLHSSHGVNLVTPGLGCGVPRGYPQLRNLEVSHLVCPNLGTESKMTIPDFLPPSAEVTPEVFITEREFTPESLAKYAAATSPKAVLELYKTGLHLGNATSFTAFLAGIAADPKASSGEQQLAFTNWNLDSDRGLGYKVWSGKPSAVLGGFAVVDEKYI